MNSVGSFNITADLPDEEDSSVIGPSPGQQIILPLGGLGH